MIEAAEQLALDVGYAPAEYCRICGRALSNTNSRLMGIGPICAAKVRGTHMRGTNMHDSVADIFVGDPTMKQEIVLRRGPNREVITNVPHRLVHHSPTGFEYGYGGSGPADLALNIAEEVVRDLKPDADRQAVKIWDGNTCSFEAWIIHHDLKFAIIGGLKQDADWTLPYHLVRETVADLLEQRDDEIQGHYDMLAHEQEEIDG